MSKKFLCQIILNDEIKKEVPYYQLEQTLKEIIKEHTKTRNGALEYLNFSSDYHTFSPDFDFVFGHLGYELENPFLKQGYRLARKKNTKGYFLKAYNTFMEEYIPYKYGQIMMSFSDDETLQIKPFSLANSKPSFINADGIQLVPYEELGHRELGRQILNFLFMKNQELCAEYIVAKKTSRIDHASFLMQYIPLIRYDISDKDQSIAAVYDNQNCTPIQYQILKEIKKKVPKALIFDQSLEKTSSFKRG